jgi:hypothetical protein
LAVELSALAFDEGFLKKISRLQLFAQEFGSYSPHLHHFAFFEIGTMFWRRLD